MTLPNQFWDEKNRDIQCLKPLQICGPLKCYIDRLDKREHGSEFYHFDDQEAQLVCLIMLKSLGKENMMVKAGSEVRHYVNKSTLKDQISSKIKELILTNRMTPGQSIVIDKLAEEFGVSHTPVREALVMLERDGLIQLNSYQNPRVAIVTVNDVRDVYEMRLMVESWAVERAALNLSDDKIQQFQDQLVFARKEAAVSNYEPHLKIDLLLHETMMRSTNNILFWSLAERIHEHSILVRSVVEATGTTQEIEQIIDEHCLIVQALFTHDPQAARKSLVAHLEAGYERTLKVLDGKKLSATSE